jgi:EAL domain-containing protein (putative c-di-GMP-specific phosphodiesterase class I)
VHGILSPGSLLPGASETSHAILTEHVITAALRDWDETGLHLHAAVNRWARSRTCSFLILEVTESEVVKDVPLMHEIATQLRICGIMFAIDDCGEGFSSFARLRELPFAQPKVDRSLCGQFAKIG